MDNENKQCFVIMPIGDQDERHTKNHFKRVYDDLLVPAIESAGFVPKRADDDLSSSMIQIEIVKDLISSPMAICDLTTRNPNVLFELGIRQAFDLPVVLIQETGTKKIFDISTINTVEYRPGRIYDEVLADRKIIKEVIERTYKNDTGINSIVRLIDNISPAKIDKNKQISKEDEILFRLSNIENILDSNRHIDSTYIYKDFIFKIIENLYNNFKDDKYSISELRGQVALIQDIIGYREIDNADKEELEKELKGLVYAYYKNPSKDFFKE